MSVIYITIGVVVVLILAFAYYRITRPMRIVASGMDLLREQDFSTRLCKVGEPNADKMVEVFNRMMDRLKEANLRLKEKNRLLDILVDVSPLGVVMLDFNEKITSLNPAARQYLVCDDSSVGSTIGSIPSALAQRMARLADGEAETFCMNDAHIYRCVRMSFLDRGFKHPFFIIESLTEEVMAAERKAYEKVIRMISHEVNNSTATICSIMQSVGEELAERGIDGDMRVALQACVERNTGMSRFITRFADVVRIPEPELHAMPVNDLVVANRNFLESLCSSVGIRFAVVLSERNPAVRADAALMAQVLVNIVKNSVESISEAARGDRNGGDVPVRTDEISVRESDVSVKAGEISVTVGDDATIEIADNGSGISEEVERQLFTPFFSTKPAGSGIGLLFIREVLIKHRCRFSLCTAPDGMTRFRICFTPVA